MRLTTKQREMLECARHYTDERTDTVGVIATAPGHTWTINSLVRRGLLEYIDHGRHVDACTDDERPIYAITDAGRAALKGG